MNQTCLFCSNEADEKYRVNEDEDVFLQDACYADFTSLMNVKKSVIHIWMIMNPFATIISIGWRTGKMI
ncbi:hypothetical protein [Niallia endozanthoxylica]|uniref:Uncharacterized protein n=1 Tax=Niallia endozanthoxylica TaxID=2036016 RepID=A0A5J5HSX9_9BACI|nr:hypothetical protein [Niallia endozanthoxylica]KAA9023926.1 hypothetical protein F4V44_12375 [Niallia endozanthoxylica]